LLDEVPASRHNGLTFIQISTRGQRVRRKWLKTALMYGIGLALLAYVIGSNWEPKAGSAGVGLKTTFSRPNRWEYFPLAAGCIGLGVSITFVRWYILVRAQDLPFSLRDAFRLGLVGYFFNTFLPGAVGGDLLKAAFIAREQQRRTVAVSTVLIDRGIGLWGLVGLCAFVGGGFWASGDPVIADNDDLRQVVKVALGLMALTLAVWLLLGVLPERRAHRFAQRLHSIPRIGKVLAEFWRAVWIYRSRGNTVLAMLILSMGAHVFTVLAFFFAARTFQAAHEPLQMPGVLEHFVIVPAGKTFQGFFPSPGGIGGAEYVFGLLYKRLGYPAEGAIRANLGTRMAEWTLGFIGLVIYLFIKRDLQHAIPGGSGHTTTDSSSPVATSRTTNER
jgi:glycosyltransferase 2 family protein